MGRGSLELLSHAHSALLPLIPNDTYCTPMLPCTLSSAGGWAGAGGAPQQDRVDAVQRGARLRQLQELGGCCRTNRSRHFCAQIRRVLQLRGGGSNRRARTRQPQELRGAAAPSTAGVFMPRGEVRGEVQGCCTSRRAHSRRPHAMRHRAEHSFEEGAPTAERD